MTQGHLQYPDTKQKTEPQCRAGMGQTRGKRTQFLEPDNNNNNNKIQIQKYIQNLTLTLHSLWTNFFSIVLGISP